MANGMSKAKCNSKVAFSFFGNSKKKKRKRKKETHSFVFLSFFFFLLKKTKIKKRCLVHPNVLKTNENKNKMTCVVSFWRRGVLKTSHNLFPEQVKSENIFFFSFFFSPFFENC